MMEVPRANDRRTCAALFAIGTALLVYGSLVPFRFRSISLVEAVESFAALFKFPDQRWGETADWSLNFTIMIPIAFFAIGAIVDGRGRWLKWISAPLVVLGCLAISLAVEFAQLWSAGRVASSRDVVAQTLGAIVGVTAWLIVGDRFSSWRRSLSNRRQPQHKLEWILQAYLVGLTIYSVVPVDLMMSPRELAQKYRSGLIELVPFSYRHAGLFSFLYSTLTDVLLYVPVGMCAASAWNRPGRQLRPVPQALLYGLFYTVGLEVAQLLVVDRYSSTTDVVLGFAGVVVGVTGMYLARENRRASLWGNASSTQVAVLWLLGTFAWAALLAVIFWAPFNFTSDVELVKSRLNVFVEVPFARMHEGSDVLGLFAAVRKVLWFVPLGALCGMALTRSPLRTHRVFSVVLGAAAMLAAALFIELGQVLLPDRVATSTDALLSAAGGLAGLLTALITLNSWRASISPSAPAVPVPLESSPNHLRGLDGLRAIACLSVFGVHFQQSTGISGRWGVFDFGQLLDNGNTGVALFFVLSGFLLALPLWTGSNSIRATEVLDGYAVKRLVRILPAYYLCLTALVLIKRHWQSRGELQDAVLHYLCLQNYSPTAFYSISSQFWTIAVQMQFYALFALIIWGLWRLHSSQRTTMICFAAIGLGSYVLHVAIMSLVSPEQKLLWGPVLSRSVLSHLPLFLMGAVTSFVFVKRQKMAKARSPRTRTICDFVVAISTLAILLIVSTPLDDWFAIPFGRYNLPYVPLLLATIIFVTPLSGIAAALLESAPIRLLGVVSYGFFIYHLAVMGLVSRAMGMAGRSPQSDAVVFAGASILLTLAVAAISHVLVERPLIDRLAGRRNQQLSLARAQAAAEFR